MEGATLLASSTPPGVMYPTPQPLPCFRSRGSSQGEGLGELFPCHFARPPFPTPTHAQAAAGHRRPWAVDAGGWQRGLGGRTAAARPLPPHTCLAQSMGALLDVTMEPGAAAWTWQEDLGTKLFSFLFGPQRTPTVQRGCRGAFLRGSCW